MRPEQAERLAVIKDLLIEEFLTEADAREWPGFGKKPAEWTSEERGNRHWTKKNAIGTAAVLRSIQDEEDRHLLNLTNDPLKQSQRDGELDKHISRYEADAAKLLKRVQEAGRS